ncbi:MAG: damage-inducible protein DinB [Bosea sp.]|nr:damage-inducible protein DinB [Bosea sp. (in: a-proteobacteria)]
MKQHLVMMAHYNRWANERVYRAAAALPEADWRADQGAFFGSLMGTLNHLLVTDRIWMRRVSGDGPVQTRLDEIVTEDLPELTRLREAEDARIIAFVEGLDEDGAGAPVTYGPLTASGSFTQPLAALLIHLFNHETHHRGQATVLLTRLAGRNACEPLDLVAFQRASGMGMA